VSCRAARILMDWNFSKSHIFHGDFFGFTFSVQAIFKMIQDTKLEDFDSADVPKFINL
jgi:hypothetical protein